MAALNESCPFCQIIQGTIPSRKVYEDEHVLVVLDINPTSRGHLLLLPKHHAATLADVPLPLVTYLASVCRQLSWVLLRSFEAEGTTIFLAQGEAAGQQAHHVFFHIIPRKEHDSIVPIAFQPQPFTMQDLTDVKMMMVHGIKQVIEGEK